MRFYLKQSVLSLVDELNKETISAIKSVVDCAAVLLVFYTVQLAIIAFTYIPVSQK